MTVEAYESAVAQILCDKHVIDYQEAIQIVKNLFLHESLMKYPEETMHDDVEVNAYLVYKD